MVSFRKAVLGYCVCLSVLGSGSACADEFFASEIEPLLKKHCYECHSHESGKMKGGLTLDSRSGWAEGGDSGPAIVPGKPAESLLIQAVRRGDKDLAMPPKKALAAAEVALLEEWVKRGAPDPRAAAVAATRAPDWWSLKPLAKPAVPPGAAHPIDAFIRGRLADAKLPPSPEADRRTLIRRLTFDLHGLPPSPEEVQAFEKDEEPGAYERLADRLLASPRYGERWARHWLDVVHYGESNGFGMDRPADGGVAISRLRDRGAECGQAVRALRAGAACGGRAIPRRAGADRPRSASRPRGPSTRARWWSRWMAPSANASR